MCLIRRGNTEHHFGVRCATVKTYCLKKSQDTDPDMVWTRVRTRVRTRFRHMSGHGSRHDHESGPPHLTVIIQWTGVRQKRILCLVQLGKVGAGATELVLTHDDRLSWVWTALFIYIVVESDCSWVEWRVRNQRISTELKYHVRYRKIACFLHLALP